MGLYFHRNLVGASHCINDSLDIEDYVKPAGRAPRLRFIGGMNSSTVNSAIVRHVESNGKREMVILGDEEFVTVFSASPAARRRLTSLLVFGPPFDKDDVAKSMRPILRGVPEEIVFQLDATTSERADDLFGLNYFIELAWRVGHSVTCGVVGNESDVFQTLETMLRRWDVPLLPREVDRVLAEFDLADRSSELRDYLRSGQINSDTRAG